MFLDHCLPVACFIWPIHGLVPSWVVFSTGFDDKSHWTPMLDCLVNWVNVKLLLDLKLAQRAIFDFGTETIPSQSLQKGVCAITGVTSFFIQGLLSNLDANRWHCLISRTGRFTILPNLVRCCCSFGAAGNASAGSSWTNGIGADATSSSSSLLSGRTRGDNAGKIISV